jgi:hypothetical protein
MVMNHEDISLPKVISSNAFGIQDVFLNAQECEQLLYLINGYIKVHSVPHIYRKVHGRSLDYRVIDGEKISLYFPEIEQIYRKVNHLLKQAIGKNLVPLENNKVRCNINITRPGGEYRWHYDRNFITGILYLNDVDGGETECYPNYRIYLENFRYTFLQKKLDSLLQLKTVRWLFGKKVSIKPKQGRLVWMQGNKCLHSVCPVQGNVDRITLIFAYDLPSTQFSIENCLDDYLYDNKQIFTSLADDPNYQNK